MDNNLFINDSFFGNFADSRSDAEKGNKAASLPASYVADWMPSASDDTNASAGRTVGFDLWHS